MVVPSGIMALVLPNFIELCIACLDTLKALTTPALLHLLCPATSARRRRRRLRVSCFARRRHVTL